MSREVALGELIRLVDLFGNDPEEAIHIASERYGTVETHVYEQLAQKHYGVES